jgi:hypothetical protein
MKTKYQKVVDFYNKTTPEQHQFFIQLDIHFIKF